jgi:hypothetical protein
MHETGQEEEITDPEKLPPMVPLMTARLWVDVGRNQAYQMVRDGTFPVLVREINGRYKVSKWDLLAYLGVPGYREDATAKQAS